MCIMCIKENIGAKYLPSPDEPADPDEFIRVPATPHFKSQTIRDIFPNTCVDIPIRVMPLQDFQGLPARA